MNTEIVRQLIDGSAAIDRMRKEIKGVLKMVLGMIGKKDITNWKLAREGWGYESSVVDCSEVFCSPECEWEITLRHAGKWELSVACRILDQNMISHAYSSGLPDIRLNLVARVHQCLPVFVDGMAKAFPILAERWQPLIDAA